LAENLICIEKLLKQQLDLTYVTPTQKLKQNVNKKLPSYASSSTCSFIVDGLFTKHNQCCII